MRSVAVRLGVVTLLFNILSLSGLCSLGDGLCEKGHEFAITKEPGLMLASLSTEKPG